MSENKKITFFDVMLEELDFDKGKVQLDEGVFPFTPFIAFSAFKQKVFNSLKNNKMFQLFGKAKEGATELKGKALTAKEKARVAVGKTSGETVYKLQPEQVSVMGTMYNKYGKELVSEILEFRKNVLAPYQVIKRIIKKSSRVSSKDITGVSREEYSAAEASGKKKIAKRGENFDTRTREIRQEIAKVDEEIENLTKVKNDLEKPKPKLNDAYANDVAKKFGLEDNPEGYSKEILKKTYDGIMAKYEILTPSPEAVSDEEYNKRSKERKRRRELWNDRPINLVRDAKEKFYKKGKFDVALGRYFFRKEIRKQIAAAGTINIFRTTYLKIVDELMETAKNKKQELLNELIGMKSGKTFTDKESKVWGKLPHIKSDSGDTSHYYKKVRDEDFLTKPIVIERSPALIEAENKIETEIKKFEHKLRTIMSEEDYDNLKRHRLVGNLITAKELNLSPKTLFKTRDELIKETGKDPDRKIVPVEKKSDEQEDLKTKKTEVKPIEISISDIEKRIRAILATEYENIDALKKDEQDLKTLIQKFDKGGGEAKSQLASLDPLLDKIIEKIKDMDEQK
jgi:hypothetical protein